MKKVFLAAVAVLAFLPSYSVPNISKDEIDNDFCFNVAINMYDASLDAGKTQLQASQIADHFYFICTYNYQ
ncbi:MAG: hypothetical protein U1C58_11605 [Flavobacteriaceae bacterium]|nr:hypothetical protein [Flavobacteriaceae bacterium]